MSYEHLTGNQGQLELSNPFPVQTVKSGKQLDLQEWERLRPQVTARYLQTTAQTIASELRAEGYHVTEVRRRQDIFTLNDT